MMGYSGISVHVPASRAAEGAYNAVPMYIICRKSVNRLKSKSSRPNEIRLTSYFIELILTLNRRSNGCAYDLM